LGLDKLTPESSLAKKNLEICDTGGNGPFVYPTKESKRYGMGQKNVGRRGRRGLRGFRQRSRPVPCPSPEPVPLSQKGGGGPKGGSNRWWGKSLLATQKRKKTSFDRGEGTRWLE